MACWVLGEPAGWHQSNRNLQNLYSQTVIIGLAPRQHCSDPLGSLLHCFEPSRIQAEPEAPQLLISPRLGLPVKQQLLLSSTQHCNSLPAASPQHGMQPAQACQEGL